MKKVVYIISAIVALVACAKEAPVVEEPVQEENQEIKVNFNISRSDIADATKATVKTGWVEDDVVFVFFADVTSPSATKYLELKYNGSTWDADLHDLTASDFDENGKITAIYLPYGSDYTVAYADGSFTIKSASSADYSGHFYISEKADYDFTGSTLTGTISLTAATPVVANDKLIHFDVSGYTSGRVYNMYQDYMKPILLTSVDLDGSVNKTIGSMGDAIPGYEDETFMSFSGVLDASVYNTSTPYDFSVRDMTIGTLYYKKAGSKTVSANMYIGLGNITSWNGVTVGEFSVDNTGTKKVAIARSNLMYRGAFAQADKKWQLMRYPWSVIEQNGSVIRNETSNIGLFGWGTSGCDNTAIDPTWIYYQPWSVNYDYSTPDYKYGYGPKADGSKVVSLIGDNANGDWGVYNTIYEHGGGVLSGEWRTPTMAEWRNIIGGSDMNPASFRGATKSYLKATVVGMPGLIIFPDSFTVPTGILIAEADYNVTNAAYDSYSFSAMQWNKMEAVGAVFLPCAGIRGGQPPMQTAYMVSAVEVNGWYWSVTANKSNGLVHYLGIIPDHVAYAISENRSNGRSVRLIRDL